MPRQIVVDIIGDASQFNAATQGAVTKAENLGSKLKGVGKGMVVGAGIASFNLLAGAIQMGVGKLDEAQDAYREDQKSQALLALALKNNIPNWDGNIKGVEDYAAAQADLGFSDDEVRDSLGQIVGVTHDATKAMELNSLAQDLARAKGLDLATASDIVTKAYQGSSKALIPLGIDVKGVTDATGILEAITKNVIGAQETWAATQEGKVGPANIKVEEAMERVGGVIDKLSQIVFPAAATGISLLADAFVIVGGIADTVFRGIADAGYKVGQVIGSVYLAIKPVLDALGVVGDFVGSVGGGSASTRKPGMQSFHSGGVVQGPAGSNQLIMAQAGETVTPRGGGGTVVNNYIQSFIGSDRDIDRFTDRIAQRLRLR